MILDGKVFSADRCLRRPPASPATRSTCGIPAKPTNTAGTSKHYPPRMAHPLWVSDVAPESIHDLTAAREQVLGAVYWAASHLDLPTLADGGYHGAGIGVHTPVKQPTNTRSSTSTPAPATPCYAAYAAWANAASPSSPTAGAPSNTSPPAPAKSAPSSKPHSSSPNSNTADSHEVVEITSLIDPDDVAAGHVIRFRRSNPDRIVRSRQSAHPAIVTVEEFVEVQYYGNHGRQVGWLRAENWKGDPKRPNGHTAERTGALRILLPPDGRNTTQVPHLLPVRGTQPGARLTGPARAPEDTCRKRPYSVHSMPGSATFSTQRTSSAQWPRWSPPKTE